MRMKVFKKDLLRDISREGELPNLRISRAKKNIEICLGTRHIKSSRIGDNLGRYVAIPSRNHLR